jgi:CheY-like chemotaxis protein
LQGDLARDSHRFGGLGLVLAISQKIVELHAGRIYATSQGRDRGASFIIELPLWPVKNKDSLPSKKLLPNLLPAQNKGARILLAEDNEPTRNALANLLTRRQYKILAVGSIAEAQTGKLPPKKTWGKWRKLDPQKLHAHVKKYPDATLKEIQQVFQVSHHAVWVRLGQRPRHRRQPVPFYRQYVPMLLLNAYVAASCVIFLLKVAP